MLNFMLFKILMKWHFVTNIVGRNSNKILKSFVSNLYLPLDDVSIVNTIMLGIWITMIGFGFFLVGFWEDFLLNKLVIVPGLNHIFNIVVSWDSLSSSFTLLVNFTLFWFYKDKILIRFQNNTTVFEFAIYHKLNSIQHCSCDALI